MAEASRGVHGPHRPHGATQRRRSLSGPVTVPVKPSSRAVVGQRIGIVNNSTGFSETVVLPQPGWQVSHSVGVYHAVLISNQNPGRFVSYHLGMAYNTLPSSALGLLDPAESNKNSAVQWSIVSSQPVPAWGGSTLVTVQGNSLSGHPFNWTVITYKRVDGVHYYVEGTAAFATRNFDHGLFQQDFPLLVQHFTIARNG